MNGPYDSGREAQAVPRRRRRNRNRGIPSRCRAGVEPDDRHACTGHSRGGPRFLHGTIAGLSTRDDVATEMSGTEFEDYVARIARSSGLPVIMTSITGDWGVDIIVGKRPNRLAIQCKRQARPVGTGAIQEVVAGAPMQDCSKTMVVTNHEFTPAARKLAELHGCELVGRSELPRLRSTIRRLTEPSEPTQA